MGFDEVLRAMAYASMVASLAYIGVRVWNAAMMPDTLRRPVAILLWLQASIYALIMAGLLLLRLAHPIPGLLYMNTALITLQALVCVSVVVRMIRFRALRLAILFAVMVMMLMVA